MLGLGKKWRPLLASLLAPVASVVALTVPIEAFGDTATELSRLERETQRIATGIKAPLGFSTRPQGKKSAAEQIVDAQLFFGLGKYDESAVILYEFVARNKRNTSYPEAIYYLGESLYRKGDVYAARTYFQKLADEVSPSSKYYPRGIERLIEINISTGEKVENDKWISRILNQPVQNRSDSTSYVIGKYRYHNDEFDKAITEFSRISKTSKLGKQALYFKGVAQVSKGDLKAATASFKEVTSQKSNSVKESKVIELSHLALGRLYYERDMPSKAIDAYLNISRKSTLFDETLYETAWVYVKDKQNEKALRALELMRLEDPSEAQTPDIRILEGNLRILRARKYEEEESGNPTEEYGNAISVFEETRNAFYEPNEQLKTIPKEYPDTRVFLSQLTGRENQTLSSGIVLPKVSAAWLRREPEVARVVRVEKDLGQIENDIKEAENTISRLELAMFSESRVNLFPKLAQKSIRLVEIEEGLLGIRSRLAERQQANLGKYVVGAEGIQMDTVRNARRKFERELAGLPGANLPESQRVEKQRNEMGSMGASMAEATTVLRNTENQLQAIESFFQSESKNMTEQQKVELGEAIRDTRREIDDLNSQIRIAQEDSLVARDQAGYGDDVSQKRRLLRTQYALALDEESDVLGALVARASGSDLGRAQDTKNQMTRASATQNKVTASKVKIDSVTTAALTEVQSVLEQEKSELQAYKAEYTNVDNSSETVSAEAVSRSFESVVDKFNEILVQTDVGLVDVAWSLRETVNGGTKKMTLSKAQELRTLDAEFSGIMREIRDAEDEAQNNAQKGEQ